MHISNVCNLRFYFSIIVITAVFNVCIIIHLYIFFYIKILIFCTKTLYWIFGQGTRSDNEKG